jgi:hypothetical protein
MGEAPDLLPGSSYASGVPEPMPISGSGTYNFSTIARHDPTRVEHPLPWGPKIFSPAFAGGAAA